MIFHIEIDNFVNEIKKEVEKNKYGVGVLAKNKAKIAKSKKKGFGEIDGMKVRFVKKDSDLDLQDLGKILQKKYKFLTKFFKKDYSKIREEILKDIFLDNNKTEENIENIYKIHIKNKDFRKNKLSTEKRKGFNHPLVDTGTFYQNIKCKKYKNN